MIKRHLFKNNILLLTDEKKNSGTASVGFWFKAGSRYESDSQRGISHLTEHMLFKGTKERSVRDIAVLFDRTGGWANAFTEKENICIYCTVPALEDNVEKAVECFCDMTQNSVFAEEELEKEKDVVIREIIAVSEDAEETALDEASAFVWKDASLGKSISGTVEDVEKISRNDLLEWYKKYISEGELIVCAAGNIDEEKIISILEKMPEHRNQMENHFDAVSFQNGIDYVKAPFQQEQIFLLFPQNEKLTVEDYWALILFNAISGDTMSSRLFETLREKTGFCYTVYSFFTFYENAGTWCAYASTEKKNAFTVTELLVEELKKIIRNGITEEELELAKKHAAGEEILGSDDSESLMRRLYRNEEMHFPSMDTDATIKIITGITREKIETAARKLLDMQKAALVLHGPSVSSSVKKKIDGLL